MTTPAITDEAKRRAALLIAAALRRQLVAAAKNTTDTDKDNDPLTPRRVSADRSVWSL